MTSDRSRQTWGSGNGNGKALLEPGERDFALQDSVVSCNPRQGHAEFRTEARKREMDP